MEHKSKQTVDHDMTNHQEGAPRVSMTIDLARRVLEASKQRARELRSPVSIAIVDAGGHLVLFERMMSPYGWATGNISIAKASTAVMFNQSTDAVAQWGASIPGFASSMSTMSEGKFIMAAGGQPIKLNGSTIGGIGISGGNAPGRDDEIARAGIAALQPSEASNPAYSPMPPMAYPQQGQPQPANMLPNPPTYPSAPVSNITTQAPANQNRGFQPPTSVPDSSYNSNREQSRSAGPASTHYLSPDQEQVFRVDNVEPTFKPANQSNENSPGGQS